MNCTRPPKGWSCTQEKGHEGPCPTIPDSYKGTCGSCDSKLVALVCTKCALELVAEPSEIIKKALKFLKKLEHRKECFKPAFYKDEGSCVCGKEELTSILEGKSNAEKG